MRHITLTDADAIIVATALAMAAENHEDDAQDPDAPARYRNLAMRADLAHSAAMPLALDDDDHDALTVLIGDDDEGTPEHDLADRLAALADEDAERFAYIITVDGIAMIAEDFLEVALTEREADAMHEDPVAFHRELTAREVPDPREITALLWRLEEIRQRLRDANIDPDTI
jgi:hypothetical protein